MSAVLSDPPARRRWGAAIPSVWADPDRIARTRALWDEGHSCSEIGRRMGCSKNSVISAAHRYGFTPRPSPIRAGGRKPGRKPVRANLSSDARPGPKPVPKRTLPPLECLKVPAPKRAGPVVRIWQPRSRLPCCWPLGTPGQPDFRFCDAVAYGTRPYCEEHCGMAYVPRGQAAEG